MQSNCFTMSIYALAHITIDTYRCSPPHTAKYKKCILQVPLYNWQYSRPQKIDQKVTVCAASETLWCIKHLTQFQHHIRALIVCDHANLRRSHPFWKYTAITFVMWQHGNSGFWLPENQNHVCLHNLIGIVVNLDYGFPTPLVKNDFTCYLVRPAFGKILFWILIEICCPLFCRKWKRIVFKHSELALAV